MGVDSSTDTKLLFTALFYTVLYCTALLLHVRYVADGATSKRVGMNQAAGVRTLTDVKGAGNNLNKNKTTPQRSFYTYWIPKENKIKENNALVSFVDDGARLCPWTPDRSPNSPILLKS